MAEPSNDDGREYELDFDETIEQLDGWARRGERMFPVETATSALYWLAGAPVLAGDPPHGLSLEDTIAELRRWLKNDENDLPDDVGRASLFWLERFREWLSRGSGGSGSASCN